MSREVSVIDAKGKSVGTVSLNPSIFEVAIKAHVVQSAVVAALSKSHSGTFSTKTRGEVRGGGKKPWKQKGTGRARAGSIRSPLWRKGGVVFGPKPRSMAVRIPEAVKQLAIKMALSDKVRDGRLKVVDQIALPEPKTKLFKEFLNSLGIADAKSYVVLGAANGSVARAASNLGTVRLSNGGGINLIDVLHSDWVVMTKEAIDKMNAQGEKKS